MSKSLFCEWILHISMQSFSKQSFCFEELSMLQLACVSSASGLPTEHDASTINSD